MVRVLPEHGIPVAVCGKLIVATDEAELPRLQALFERAEANGLPATADRRRSGPASTSRTWPAWPRSTCASTGIVDYAAGLPDAGRADREGRRFESGWARGHRAAPRRRPTVVQTTAGDFGADHLINCAGLHSDRVARLAGLTPPARIIPFRGEYYELRPERRDLVSGLIYPVPDPQFPFLGVHLTRMIDGSVHAGPNAVLALGPRGVLVGADPPARRRRRRRPTPGCGGWPASTCATG